MANMFRTRKRVFPLRRAQDGSAFQKCDLCGVSVAVALFDMHECNRPRGRRSQRVKCKSINTQSVKCEDGNQTLTNPSFPDQPRSAFSIFMESYKEANVTEDGISVDRKGFEKWKSMSVQERQCFVIQADKVNLAYEQALMREEVEVDSEVEDEADSAKVGILHLSYEEYSNWENSGSFEIPHFTRIERIMF